MAIKLDMAKAYDQVEWSFLQAIMLRLGFASEWVKRIMDCLTTVTFSVLWKGFSRLLQNAERIGSLRGIRIAHGAPSVNHLFFADDRILFLDATTESCETMKNIFQVYEETSGQKINLTKSAFRLSPNATVVEKQIVLDLLEIPLVSCHEKYLGSPMVTGKGRKQIFGTVKDRIGKRISGWKEKLLSRAGKEVLIKAVLQAMPTYLMSCFWMPKGMCKELHGLMAKFWWFKSKNMRGIHWTKWETICVSKQIEGLGFRDLDAFNQALLAKQSWRLFFNCNSLAARIFKARYFPHCNFLEAGLGYRPSRIWSSLIWGKDLLKAGLRWRVGNGEDIYVYQDRWVPLPMNFKIISTPQFDVSMKACSEVKPIWSLSPWSANHHEWRITSFKELWQAVIVVSSKQEVDLFAFLCWDIWNDRNNLLFQGRSLESVSVFNKALAYQTEFYSYKINVDGAAKLAGLVRGVGVVIRNGNKEFMAACSRQVIGHFSAQAAKEGLQFAYDLGFHDIVLEMDTQGVVDRINSNEECFEAEGNIVEDIKEMQGWFRSFSCNWQRRKGNKVAHELAQFGTRNAGFFTWIEEEPLWLTPFLSADLEANG
ncbi:PREDICTED: uncharacterized protein LOC107881115 [Prunus mume]|uniref:Uncharacterized protein LOC107881115 n=1 Tax=Prunus mume TaxID=102107 RepID=A0ABM1LQL8_PRUMU|nr:PREDICTED: uncharacterized protein LOC107881115 [Prunus mume]